MKKNYSSVIVTGSIGYDLITDFPGKFVDYIQKDKLHQLNLSFVVNRLEKQIGGIATNISYNLSLGTKKKIIILGAIGKDGQSILNFFRSNHIDVKGIIFDKKIYTANGSVITDIKDNQIWSYYYGASSRGQEIDLKKFINGQSLLTISSSHPAALFHFQEQAKKLKIDYLYDPGLALSVIPKNKLIDGVKHCRYLVGNDYEIALILKTAGLSINTLLQQGIAVITTLGEKGVVYQEIKNKISVPAYRVKKVVDPTGAGDAWRGGFITGLLEKKELVDCLKLGNALASFAIEKYGTVNHRPTKNLIEARAKSLKFFIQ